MAALLRYRFLTSFATLGSLASILFYFLPSTSIIWPVCTLFALVANVSFGAGGVCLNSFRTLSFRSLASIHIQADNDLVRCTVPSLARLSPAVSASFDSLQVTLKSPSSPSESSDSHDLLLRYTQLRSQETSRISSKAIAMGYAAGIGVLIGLLPIVRWLSAREGDETWPLRVAIAVSGALWLIGTVGELFFFDEISL